MPTNGDLRAPEVDVLATAVEEAARAANVQNPRFVEPASGTLNRAKSRRHHVVFGRRGSGKTSLLAKAAADLTVDRRPIAFVDLETFKGHSYPDVLLSVLIDALAKFKTWFETAATNPASKTTFWKRLFGTSPKRPPLKRADVASLVNALGAEIEELERHLHLADEADVRTTVGQEQQSEDEVKAGGKAHLPGAAFTADISSTDRAAERSETVEQAKRSKLEFLHRNILSYQRLFRRVADVSDGDAFLFLDDLYHLRRLDQPYVLDYFHRIAKGNRLWLKAGTIKHRTDWYRHSDPPVGVKLGDDADEIDLDVTLEKYRSTKDFLLSILEEIAEPTGVDSVRSLMAATAVDRLVLASGGVARDFLALFRRSIDVARDRGGGARGPRIAAQDVNQAAGEHDSAKRDELRRDTLEERENVEKAFDEVRTFCLENANSNCFLIQKDRTDVGARLIEELVDLRLLHLVQSRVTIPNRPGKLFIAYMLDLGQYTGERKRRKLEMIPFWQTKARERLRRASLVYEPWVPKRLAQQNDQLPGISWAEEEPS